MVKPTQEEFAVMMGAIKAYGDARADLAARGVLRMEGDWLTPENYEEVSDAAHEAGRTLAAVRDAIGGKVIIGGATYQHGKRIK